MSPAIISLIILVVCIFLFITKFIPNAVVAVLGCMLFAITGVCDMKTAFSGFSNSIVLLMFGMMVVGIAMMDTGVARIIGEKVTALSKHNEKLFILMAGIASIVLSAFLSNTAVIAIFLPIIESVSKSDSKISRKNLTLPVTLGAMFGGAITLVGSTPQLTANGILEEMANKSLKMFDFMPVGLILCAVYLIYVEIIGYRLGEKIWGQDSGKTSEDDAVISKETSQPTIEKSKIITVSIIFILTIISFIGAWIPTEMTAVIAALLCLITRCTTQKSVIKNMDWSVVFILAGCLGIASGITKGGAGDLLASMLSGILGPNIPVIVIFAFFIVATMLISNFVTNSTAVVIMLPIALSVCSANSFNPISFALGIVYAANLTYSTPLANAQTAMTLVAGYKFSDYFKYTGFLALLICLSIIVFVPIFFPLI